MATETNNSEYFTLEEDSEVEEFGNFIYIANPAFRNAKCN